MQRRAMVSPSTFQGILMSIRPSELNSVRSVLDRVTNNYQTQIEADVSLQKLHLWADRLLASTQDAGHIPTFDILAITCVTQAGDFCWENEIGSLYLWAKKPIEERE